MTVPAILFDCDGVLADTERDGHLVAFNRTFDEFSLPVHWSDADYAEKVLIGGGKERLASLLTPDFVAAAGLDPDEASLAAAVANWHRRKTEIYTALVAEGALPARPGILRLVTDAAARGLDLAVASTSAEVSVRAVLEHAVGRDLASCFRVFAGDIVEHKKPAPDIYLAALDAMSLGPDDAVVVEDSANGLRAALAAGLRCIVTVSGYTRGEDFTGASLVVSSLGDPGGETAEVLDAAAHVTPSEAVTVDDVLAVLAAPRPATDAEPDPASDPRPDPASQLEEEQR